MKSIYQAVLDAAREKRLRLIEVGYEPSGRLKRIVMDYQRTEREKESEKLLGGKKR